MVTGSVGTGQVPVQVPLTVMRRALDLASAQANMLVDQLSTTGQRVSLPSDLGRRVDVLA